MERVVNSTPVKEIPLRIYEHLIKVFTVKCCGALLFSITKVFVFQRIKCGIKEDIQSKDMHVWSMGCYDNA